jgi:hypothetical protein
MDALQGLPVDAREHKALRITPSKHVAISDKGAGGAASAGGAGVGEVRDFTASTHHRFLRGLPAKLPNAACQTLHFSNVPPSVTEERLRALITAAGAPQPLPGGFKFLDAPSHGDRGGGAGGEQRNRRTGFIDFADVPAAVQAIMLLNHMPLEGVPLKLAFASRPSRPQPATAGAGGSANGVAKRGNGKPSAAVNGGAGGDAAAASGKPAASAASADAAADESAGAAGGGNIAGEDPAAADASGHAAAAAAPGEEHEVAVGSAGSAEGDDVFEIRDRADFAAADDQDAAAVAYGEDAPAAAAVHPEAEHTADADAGSQTLNAGVEQSAPAAAGDGSEL